MQFQWCVGYQVRREEGVNGISLIWRNILKSSNDLHYSNDKLFHIVTPKPFEKFQVKANSQDFLTPSEISQAQDRSQIHIMVTCAPLETEAMENNHRWHPAHLPHSSIKKLLQREGEEVFGPKSGEVSAVVLTCSHLSYQPTKRVRCERQTQSTVLMSCMHTDLFWALCQKMKSFKTSFLQDSKAGEKNENHAFF